ncbi:MAG TPA: zinc-binding alcohol dehydrogenase family protein [Acidimicrobiales bacterium]|nr:zinc-binding alcohol dehydrogenase family protein [Acidimicrobiales bacterium]
MPDVPDVPDVTAARLVEPGEPLRVERVTLGNLDGDGDGVLVRMLYAGISPADRRVALGAGDSRSPVPRTVGMTGVGLVGDRLVCVHGHGVGTRRDGTWSSWAILPSGSLIDVPAGAAPLTVAAMGFAGVAAWRAVIDLGRVTAADRVLVLGASGGVGSLAVSLARSLGATVWGQSEMESKMQGICAQGAHRVVVARPEGLAEAVGALRPTVVVDPLGGDFTGAALAAMAPHGRLVLLGTSADPSGGVPLRTLYRQGLTIFGYGGFLEDDDVLAAAFVSAMAAVADGRLRPRVDSVVPLARVNEGLERLASRLAEGRVVLDLSS